MVFQFVRAVASVARVARVHDAPILVTRCRDDEFSQPLRRAAETHLPCRATDLPSDHPPGHDTASRTASGTSARPTSLTDEVSA
ncbi:hypothetical protein SAMN04487937_2636 [Halorubrum sodomense]|uniref:Uncharacterized protein n=1 Tax=Halorubrum sodomense TaxID=35743 RepID=A0A1I6HBP5_HALSD|nr:hypothetical protein SAMN04487937_2636 [Halorubrum sodomense]